MQITNLLVMFSMSRYFCNITSCGTIATASRKIEKVHITSRMEYSSQNKIPNTKHGPSRYIG